MKWLLQFLYFWSDTSTHCLDNWMTNWSAGGMDGRLFSSRNINNTPGAWSVLPPPPESRDSYNPIRSAAKHQGWLDQREGASWVTVPRWVYIHRLHCYCVALPMTEWRGIVNLTLIPNQPHDLCAKEPHAIPTTTSHSVNIRGTPNHGHGYPGDHLLRHAVDPCEWGPRDMDLSTGCLGSWAGGSTESNRYMDSHCYSGATRWWTQEIPMLKNISRSAIRRLWMAKIRGEMTNEEFLWTEYWFLLFADSYSLGNWAIKFLFIDSDQSNWWAEYLFVITAEWKRSLSDLHINTDK